MTDLTLSASEISTWMRCPREWQYHYLRGLSVPEESAPLAAGKVLHIALAARRRGAPLGKQLIALNDSYSVATVTSPKLTFVYPLAYLQAVLSAYNTRYDPDPFLTVRAEEHILLLESSMGPVEGILDALGTGKFLDTKTTAKFITDTFYASFSPNVQFQHYWCLLDEQGTCPSECWVDIVRLDPKTRTVKPEHFIRYGPVTYSEGQLAEHRATVLAVRGEIAQAQERGYFRQNPGACLRGSQLCDYHPLCSIDPSIRDARILDLYCTRGG